MILYLHFLPDALAAEVLGFVEVVCSKAACQGDTSQSVRGAVLASVCVCVCVCE